ncbi:PROTEASOME REGULATORY SUBUNIT 8 [Encephalitozoon cuniculi GB-M1]|uniref:Probable proteasome subunit alpha type-7 n=2 Tax=Encephalitozoon cuniculi TaxID=6035 RepID=PSA7_ENCCU|nr:proteasome core particle subunit alpha 7 [Encephalitozoon cuniculi GB-M1]Q8SQP9.1 RecName: Full=Probable proteasome subunit alpha type-7; AltName: Full=26S proteasome alpha-type subunit PRE10; AltName: Full=Multicatalytic endopeptidase complex subunit PRE10 [Encephalitozoon cuniculi GB-M1]AGE96238.1 proteasome regulatory subunit 8 [Encephalitozoon cuniculi]KMV65512.1 proteasome subunit alpha [Encephalitozoon cuniculi EcunIII-L]UYI26711.1 proteasome regulatory subunit alpha [Encephalitozoon c
MSNLDFCTIYTTTGQIDQLSYAQKAADSGDTCIGMKSKHGVVLLAEKPRVSPLYILESDEKIRKIGNTIGVVCTGMSSDTFYVGCAIKDYVFHHKENFNEDPTPGMMKVYLNDIFHYFTRGINLRVLGANTLTSVYKDGSFSLLHTDCSGKTLSYKAACIGKGTRRIKTELEKLDIDTMTIEEMVDVGVKVLYMAHDPSKDKEFDIEIGIASMETGGDLRKLENHEIRPLVGKYKHISVDED